MAQTAQIGALNVSLTMSSAQFLAAAKNAEGVMARLTTRFGVAAGAGAAAGQLLANSLVGAARGIAGGFTGAIHSIGELVDASEKFGVPIQQLAGLKHAAELSGASLEVLGVGAGKLAKSLAAIAGGSDNTPAGKALASLGIAATDAAGQIKSVDDIMIEVADRFAGAEDGAVKTAIAMQLFGKSGAQLIPTLNLGSAELARLRDEARRLGIVLDDDTARGLERLGDEWQKVQKRLEGFWSQLAGQLLPTMQLLVKDIQAWIDSGGGAQQWAANVANGIKTVVDWAYQASATFNRLTTTLGTLGANAADLFTGRWAEIAERNRANADELRQIDQQLSDDLRAIWAKHAEEAPGPQAHGAANQNDRMQLAVPDAGAALEAETEAMKLRTAEWDAYLERRRTEKDILAEINPVAAQLADTQDKLGRAYQKGAIDAETFGLALAKAGAVAANSYASVAQSIVGDLGKVFENNKAVAYSMALINTFQGVTNALANVPYPLNFAAAATSLAAGMAQVANIRKTTKNGGGGGAGASASTPASTGQAAAQQPQQGVFVTLQGSMFSREQVFGLIDAINDAGKDGKRVITSAA